MNLLVRRRLVDEAIDAYVDWQEECLTVADAYRRWTCGSPDERHAAFAAYTAALDREQRASSVYADRCHRVPSGGDQSDIEGESWPHGSRARRDSG